MCLSLFSCAELAFANNNKISGVWLTEERRKNLVEILDLKLKKFGESRDYDEFSAEFSAYKYVINDLLVQALQLFLKPISSFRWFAPHEITMTMTTKNMQSHAELNSAIDAVFEKIEFMKWLRENPDDALWYENDEVIQRRFHHPPPKREEIQEESPVIWATAL